MCCYGWIVCCWCIHRFCLFQIFVHWMALQVLARTRAIARGPSLQHFLSAPHFLSSFIMMAMEGIPEDHSLLGSLSVTKLIESLHRRSAAVPEKVEVRGTTDLHLHCRTVAGDFGLSVDALLRTPYGRRTFDSTAVYRYNTTKLNHRSTLTCFLVAFQDGR